MSYALIPTGSSSPTSSPSPSPTSQQTPPVPFGALPLSSVPPPAFPKHKKPRNGPDLEQWTTYQPRSRQYFMLYDGQQEPINVEMVIKIDKVDQREHYSAADEAYILYRQNQFQLEVFMFGQLGSYSSNYPTEAPTSASTPSFIEVNGSLVAIESLFYHVYALRQQKGEPVENTTEPETMVDLVQLGGPRNRKDFQPPSLCPIVHGRASYTRLQFRTATPNNARSHPDQPSPKQQIVLSLVAQTNNALYFIFSKISPCFIVRGQNPGKFSQGRAADDLGTLPLPLPLSPPRNTGKTTPPIPNISQESSLSTPPLQIRSSSPSPPRSRSSSPSPHPSPRSGSPTPQQQPSKSVTKMITKTKSSSSLVSPPPKHTSTIPPLSSAHPNPPIGRNHSPPRSATKSPHPIPNPSSSPSPSGQPRGPSPSPNSIPTHLLHQYSKILPHYAPPSAPPQSSYFPPNNPPPPVPRSATPPAPPAQMRGTKRLAGEGEWHAPPQGARYPPDEYPPPPQYRKHNYPPEEEYHPQYGYRSAQPPPHHESAAYPPSPYGKSRPTLGVGQEYHAQPPASYGRPPVIVRPPGYDEEWAHHPPPHPSHPSRPPPSHPHAQLPPHPHHSPHPPHPAHAGHPPPHHPQARDPGHPSHPHSAHPPPPPQYSRRPPPYGYDELPPYPPQYASRGPPPGYEGEDWSTQYSRMPHSDEWHTQLGRRPEMPYPYHPQYGRRPESPTNSELLMGIKMEQPPPPGSKKLPFSSIR